ncbi:MAG: DUF5518 domain-containing protein [Halobacteriales archaeon]
MSITEHPSEYRDSDNQSAPASRVTTLRNGLVGGVVAVLLSFLPLSTVLGGAVAGYLDRRTGDHGSSAGAIAGLIAFLPYLMIGVYLTTSSTSALLGLPLGLSPAVAMFGVTSFVLVYTVGLSVLGSLLGGFVHDG